ncbi:MAG: trehalose-phosphatase [Alphaproteobacteria bacterium]|nr:trehalose-phosphatase [Alphaproteobacteria bacterium]MBV9373420.1 trehalose-phosphatase [Alphaproteobacteria bacterium]MBV9902548.1 trehalose-phosphatase [Alphaproteobacteria bacterium]
MSDSLPPPPSIQSGDALFLDLDGTLIELADTPDSVRVPDALGELLGRLAHRLEGRVAIVSGRALADVDRHLGRVAVTVAGSHGAELRLRDGGAVARPAPPGLEAARAAAARLARDDSRLLIEEKPAGVAVHFRAAPEREAEVGRFAAALAEQTGLRLQKGKMVAELLAPGCDKGEALRAMMAEPSFAGARPLFVGDDLTDEHGFEAAAAAGGGGILVGAPRATAARWRIGGVAAVLRWLDEGSR